MSPHEAGEVLKRLGSRLDVRVLTDKEKEALTIATRYLKARHDLPMI